MDKTRNKVDPVSVAGTITLILLFALLWWNGNRVLDDMANRGAWVQPDPSRPAITAKEWRDQGRWW